MVYRACVVQVLLSTTENWAMWAARYQLSTSPMLLRAHAVHMLNNRGTQRDRITATQLAANLGLPSFSDLGQHLNTDNGWQEGTHATTPHPAANAVRLDGRATPAGGGPATHSGGDSSKPLNLNIAGFPGRAAFGALADEPGISLRRTKITER